MGFIRQGRFHLLFSAGLPIGKRKPGVDVPSTFEQLEGVDETTEAAQPRGPGCIAAKTSRQAGAGLDVTVPILQCVLSPGPFAIILKQASPRSLELDANFSFKLIGDRGAALTTRHQTYNEDSQLDSEFKEYTKRHYKSWVKFARDKKYGKNLRPVLVSGFDMTKDFAMMAYSNNSTSGQSNATSSTPMFGPPPASGWGVWLTECTPYVKHGPQQLRPPGLPSLKSKATESRSTEFNQCVFVRYYTMREGLFPKVIRANAGPHDLGSGENRGDTFPELTVRSNANPVGSDEDPGGQWDPATYDTDSELDVVIRNVPYVRSFACPPVSALTFASRMKNTIVGMPSQTTCSR